MKVIKCSCYENQRCNICEELNDDIVQLEEYDDDEIADKIMWVCKDCLKRALELLNE